MPHSPRSRCWLLLTAFAVTGAVGADEFGAMPGLWKTTYQSLADGKVVGVPETRWHCVDEEADPWAAFAELEAPRGEACDRTNFDRSVSTLKWRMACTGPQRYVSEGALVFDSPKHYTGTLAVAKERLVPGVHPALRRVEGKRVAACTSPSD